MKMYLRIIVLLLVAMNLQHQAFAQEEKNTQYQFKMHSNFEYTLTNSFDIVKYKTFQFDITPSFVISKPKVSHEIGISKLRTGNESRYKKEEILADGSVIAAEETKLSHFYLNIRYEYGLNLIKINKQHQLSIAASVEPYIRFNKFVPRVSTSFPNQLTTLGSKLHLIPRATFTLSDRLFLDVNIPVEIVDVHRFRSYNDNPTYTEEQKTYTDTRSKFLDSVFRFRVGLGFNL